MPVEFLSNEQKEGYGRFIEKPSLEQLARYFLLDDQDKMMSFKCRGEHNQLGFAIQLTTVRFLGTFLVNPIDVPENVVNYIAKQLNIHSENLVFYKASRSIWSHIQEIKRIYEYHDFSEQPYHWRLVRWLYNHFWLASEHSNVIFDLAVKRCLGQKVLLPGITVLERLILQIRERATSKLWYKLSSLPDDNQRDILEKLLVADSKNTTALEKLRQPFTHNSPVGFLKAIERVNTIYSIGAHKWNICKIPIGKIRVLSRHASVARAQTIERMPDEKRIATLVAMAIIYTISSQDDVIDYMERYFSVLFNKSNRKGQKNRLRTLKDLDFSARELSKACALLMDEKVSDKKIRETIFSSISKEKLQFAIGTVNTLTRAVDQTVEYKELFSHYSSVRRFLPKLLVSIEFNASVSGQSALTAWKFLSDVQLKTGKNKFANAPIEGISASWKRVVFKGEKISSCPYTFWVIERMLEGIKNHDIYLKNSDRYSDPRTKLLNGTAWENARSKVLSMLGWSANAEESLNPLKKDLDIVFKNTMQNWDENPAVRIEIVKGKEKIVLTHLDRLEEPDSLLLLRKQVNSLLPNTDLPELILELHSLTGFMDEFTHISQGGSRMKDLPISICAVLIANACNIGLEAVSQIGIPALEYDRLTWVEQNYFRNETLTQANAVLVKYLSTLNLAKIWGSGKVASADGIRFIVPPKTIYAGPNPKYFGIRHVGITSYDLINDQFGGLNRVIITGTIRDSLSLIDVVLGQKTSIQPSEIMTDTAGYSDIVFGIFALLGYQFSPRLADIGSSKLWRFDSNADYGVLNNLSKDRKINNVRFSAELYKCNIEK